MRFLSFFPDWFILRQPHNNRLCSSVDWSIQPITLPLIFIPFLANHPIDTIPCTKFHSTDLIHTNSCTLILILSHSPQHIRPIPCTPSLSIKPLHPLPFIPFYSLFHFQPIPSTLSSSTHPIQPILFITLNSLHPTHSILFNPTLLSLPEGEYDFPNFSCKSFIFPHHLQNLWIILLLSFGILCFQEETMGDVNCKTIKNINWTAMNDLCPQLHILIRAGKLKYQIES